MRAPFTFLVGLACAAAGAQSSFTMSGKVVDGRSGQPVARCVVEINPTTQRTASLSVMTGDDGHFVFRGLAAGKYQLSAAHRGYLTQSYQAHESFSTAVAVGPGLASDDLLFPLTPQSIVYGIVTDEAGDPIRRARVRLFADRGQDGIRSTLSRQGTTTDDLGKYELAEIPPGNYYLAVTAQPWYAHGVGELHFVEPPQARAADEAPDSALDVAYPTTFYPNATDSGEATPIPLRGGEHLEMNMTLNAQHALRLRVPVPHVEGGNFNITLAQSIFGIPETVTTGIQANQDGVLEIDGVLPGRYDVTLQLFGNTPNAGPTHFSADVAAGATTFSEAETVDEVTVTGKVSGLEGKVPQAGIALLSRHPQHNYYAQLDDSGGFSVKVPPGDYEVIGHIPRNYLARVASENAPVHGRMLEVKSGASPTLAIAAGTGYGTIEGFVTSGSQRPGGVMVLLAPEDAKDNQILFRRDQSDSDGSFSLNNIIPGRYRLLAIDQGWDLAWNDSNVLSAFVSKSIPIQVHEGEKQKQLVEVQPR